MLAFNAKTGLLKIEGVSAEMEVEDTCSRYDLQLTYNRFTKLYTISISNLGVCMETPYPLNCVYKLEEKGTPTIDATAIQEILERLLFPRLQSMIKGGNIYG